MINIYLDIETAASQDSRVREYYTKSIEAPSNYKDTDKIEAYIASKSEEAAAKSSLDGLGHIICIGVAIDDEPVIDFHCDSVIQEKSLLNRFYAFLDLKLGGNFKPKTFIGHNIVGFDLPILKKRSMVLGVKPPSLIPFDAKPWDSSVFDSMTRWDVRNFVSQEKLCMAFGIEGKQGMDGSMVNQAFLDGKIEEIAAYCRNDVEVVRNIYKRMTFEGVE